MTKPTESTSGNMKPVQVYIPRPDLKKLDDLVRKKMYPNRNEAIRFAIRDLIRREWSK